MRIAMVGTKGVPAPWGGIEKYIEEVGKRLVVRGHDVTVFGSKWFLKDYPDNMYCGMRIRRVPALHHQATDALSNALCAAVLVSAGGYDIVHYHGYASYFFVPLIKMLGIKTVVTAHSVDAGWDNPKYGSFARIVLKACFKKGIINGDVVTTVADYLKGIIKDKYDIIPVVLPSGVEEVTFNKPDLIRKTYGLEGDNYILFLGRIDPIKRIDWLLDLRDVIDDTIYIVISGGAQDSKTEEYLEGIMKAAGEKNNFIFTGPVQGKLKSELFSNCRLFLNPSQNEGLPITVIEAMSYGRCCIVSDIPAHSEIISHGDSGFLFSNNNKAEFISLVGRICSQPRDVSNSIGDNARRNVLQNYNWEKTSDGFDDIYRQVMMD